MRLAMPRLDSPVEILKTVWDGLKPDSCPYRYNFHLHTVFSDGRLDPTNLIDQALTLGLEGLAITDHHTLGGYWQARHHLEHYGSVATGLRLWTGVEINAALLDIEVHILGYGFDPHHAALQPYLQRVGVTGDAYQAGAVIESIHAAGGLAVLAHPARYKRPAAELIPVAASLGIDGAEAYYGYGNPQPWEPSPVETAEVLTLADRFGLWSTCGTDTHGLNIQARI
ncbi:MAG: PHP domain-containing protein [Gloeomargaritaceae cyanobacterium C42_A2020_066]|nr:PHP domain-containing protein [Gloeomargaritaceae cyanobacterium C42_A2020_066]